MLKVLGGQLTARDFFWWVCTLSLSVVLSACGGGSPSGNDNENTMSSSSSSSSEPALAGSHNAGQDCMQSGCHAANSAGPEFRAAGTVYQSGGVALVNAVVRLYIHNTNTLSAELQTDGNGNFFTSMAVDGLFTGGDLVTGVDVEVEGRDGIRTMPGLVTNGSCNSCHGSSVGAIVAN
ncbi:hypothetical protein [Teredinibacter purpureus]|uniref:hypothetical protein n=1 Tax=Teredinibacter purpureus TaxID=2731756 RepID=UPI0005F87987|nr:hypothetical protein [Teredinibacter purpureus]